MRGTNIRTFTPLPNLSLEELVPRDNFYRHLEKTLDLLRAEIGAPALRGFALGVPTDGGRCRSPEYPLVPGLQS